jgi:hypothetical protein
MAGCDSGYDMHQSRYLHGTVYDTIALPNATGDPDHLLSKCCAKCTADGKKCDGWQFGEICDDPNPPSGTEITLFPCAVSSDSQPIICQDRLRTKDKHKESFGTKYPAGDFRRSGFLQPEAPSAVSWCQRQAADQVP